MKAKRTTKMQLNKNTLRLHTILCMLYLFTTQTAVGQLDEIASATEEKKSILEKPIGLFFRHTAEQDSTKKSSSKYKVKIDGVITVHYLNEFNTNGDTLRDPDGFRIFRARFSMSGRINKFTSYQIQVDPRSPEHGGVLRDAYIDLSIFKNQTLRIGQQKTQFGYENRVSATELYTVNHSEVSDHLARGYNLREAGLGLLGQFKLNTYLQLENAFTFTNGAKMNVTGPYDFSNTKNGWGRIGLRYKKKEMIARLGFSGGTGGVKDLGNDLSDPTDDSFYYIKRYGTDVQVDHKYFFVAAEYAKGTNLLNDTLENIFGYYVTLVGKTKWNIGPLFRYENTDEDFNRLTAGLYYGKPKDKFRVIINYEFRKNIKDIPEGHDDRLYIQMQIAF